MKAAEIRERFLSYFEERGHRRMPSASLVPPSYDPSVLLTTAGMQPFKPYFRGEEKPPQARLTSCQKCFRTVDIDVVGTTKRHLTFFEMLGNFSIGDYFKQGAVEYAMELSTSGFGLDPERIWITVFGGDDELGLGPDEEAIDCWHSVGVPDERIVRLGSADHVRGMTFLLGDGVVPSNEDRGYVLRRIMRRAIQQGRVLGIDGAFLPALAERVVEVMGGAYPELEKQAATITRWAAAEEESF